MHIKKGILFIAFSCICLTVKPQDNTKEFISSIFDNCLNNTEAYQNLQYLCEHTPGRLIGTKASLQALEYMKQYIESLDVDTVFLQEYKSKAWISDSVSLSILGNENNTSLNVVALGPSGSTQKEGIQAKVIEVKSLQEVEALGRKKVEGNIIFYNRPMSPTMIEPFWAYGGAVDQRYYGPSVAAKYGAVGAIVRSINHNIDEIPHTGSFSADSLKIPAIAVSTNDAELLSKKLAKNPTLRLHLFVDARDMEITTYNLIADIKGHENPEEIMLVGGHIDTWHNTAGAHDDGAGCMHAVEVLRVFKEKKIKNKRTIRAILYMDEEMFTSGAEAYAKYTEKLKLKHYFALESDVGAFSPRGFTIDASEKIVQGIARFQPYLEPYGIYYIKKGYGGVDINHLKKFDVPVAGYNCDAHRYFDLHHNANDRFDKINFREMQMGSGSIASLIYLIDKYGIIGK